MDLEYLQYQQRLDFEIRQSGQSILLAPLSIERELHIPPTPPPPPSCDNFDHVILMLMLINSHNNHYCMIMTELEMIVITF